MKIKIIGATGGEVTGSDIPLLLQSDEEVHLLLGIGVYRIRWPLRQRRQGEQRQQCADEDVSQLVHRSSY